MRHKNESCSINAPFIAQLSFLPHLKDEVLSTARLADMRDTHTHTHTQYVNTHITMTLYRAHLRNSEREKPNFAPF